MSNKQRDPAKPGAARQIGAALKDLLDRARAGANDLMGLLNPAPRPALQPVPVRSPHWPARKQVGRR